MSGDARSKDTSLEKELSISNKLPTKLPAAFLKEITKNLSEERVLGNSVFGTVYMGILEMGDIIAVKKLHENSPVAPGKSFDTEVANLMAFQHDNIVELVGYCHEEKRDVVPSKGRYVVVNIMESFLWYKYLPNGTLDKYLNDDVGYPLNWDKRFKIIKRICQGLQFLHNKPEGPLIHMNIVPTSIWLDDNWVPKIADFGLSRIVGQEQTRINTIHVMGQNGYMAPEYLYRGEISTKSDIYSLGMLIIEITTGEKNCGSAEDRAARNFVDKVHKEWSTNVKTASKYPSLNAIGLQEVRACITIEDIVKKLNGEDVPIFNEVSTV